MNRILERAISTGLVLAAIAIAASVVARTFFPGAMPRAAEAASAPDYLSSWKTAIPIGVRQGDSTARVTIVELTDLECPACRGYQPTLQEIRREHPHDVSIIYVPFPLPEHRFALGAARGAECARRVGRFSEWVDVVFRNQDSLGLKSWGSFAQDAGIADTSAIAKCAVDPSPVARIQAGVTFGNKINISGTPTVIVDGWRFTQPPTHDELSQLIGTLEKGETPHGRTG